MDCFNSRKEKIICNTHAQISSKPKVSHRALAEANPFEIFSQINFKTSLQMFLYVSDVLCLSSR